MSAPEDEAVPVIVGVLRQTVLAIVDGTWQHPAESWPKTAEYKLSRSQYFKTLKYNTNVKPFLLGPANLQLKLQKIREMFTRSLRNFKYDKHTPLVVAHLGGDAVGGCC